MLEDVLEDVLDDGPELVKVSKMCGICHLARAPDLIACLSPPA